MVKSSSSLPLAANHARFSELVEQTLAYARQIGASDAAAEVSESLGLSVSVRKNDIETVEQTRDQMCIRDRLDIDPLYAGETHLRAGGLRMMLAETPGCETPQTAGYPHMAIHPYPARLVQVRRFADGIPWVLRPIRPEDGQPLQDFIRGLSERSRYMRFVSMMRELTPRMVSRYTQVDLSLIHI